MFSGVSGAEALREVLARLDTRSRRSSSATRCPCRSSSRRGDYDTDFYKAMGFREAADLSQRLDENVAAMRPPKEFEGFD